jgi:hypothetical protein
MTVIIVEVYFYADTYLQNMVQGVKGLIKCKFLERYRVPTVTLDGNDYIESERCRLGNEIPLDGCVENCPDFEPGK